MTPNVNKEVSIVIPLLSLPEIVLKAKWKGLRDNFRVEYKRIPRADNGDFMVDPATFESKWLHYYALLFLSEL